MAEKKTQNKKVVKETTKKVEEKKTTTKKNTTKKAEPKKTAAKKVEVKPVVVEEVKTKDTKKEAKVVTFVKENISSILLVIVSILLLGNIILIAVGHNVELKDGEEVVASIKGKKITAEDLFKNLKKQYGTSTVVNMIDDFITDKEVKDDDDALEYAESQVEAMKYQYETYGYDFDEVLAQYGYSSESELVDVYKTTYKKEIVVKEYLKENKVTDDEIQKYYDEEIYGDYNAKHILIKSTATDDMSEDEKTKAEDAAKAKAEEVIQKLKDGAEWSTLVKEYSEDAGSVDGDGLIENFTKGDVVDEFFNSVKDLKDGEYTATPVKSTYGYHVILRVSASDKPKLKDKKDDIVDALVENYLSNDQDLYDDTWVEIRKSYKLNINDSAIEKNYNAIIGE